MTTTECGSPSTAEISLNNVKRVAVSSQLLELSSPRPSAEDIIKRLGCVQVDAMQAVQRSHELVLMARGVTPSAARATLRGASGLTFETWGHAHSILHQELWPALAWRRRLLSQQGWRGPTVDFEVARGVQKRIGLDGPLTLSDLGSTSGQGWNRSSEHRWACEWMLGVGELACTYRSETWQRVYALPSQVLPSAVLEKNLDDETCIRELIGRALDALGIATTKDVADYFRMGLKSTALALHEGEFRTVRVEGSAETWFVSSYARDALGAEPAASVEGGAIIPVSPLDSLVWTRSRQFAVFGKDYRLESYIPAAKRKFGYFAMPLLEGHRIIGRIAARRRGKILWIEGLETDYRVATHRLDRVEELLLAWSGCEDIAYERLP